MRISTSTTLLVAMTQTHILLSQCSAISLITRILYFSLNIPEEHEDGGWHQEDLIAGNEFEDVLLIDC